MECEDGVPLEVGAGGKGRGRGRGRGRCGEAVGRRLPVLVWARRYGRLAAAADAVAGLTLGLTLVPQAIAYAALADLPVQYGLYSSFMGTILYAFLGTVKEVSIGPTSLMALLTLQACGGLPAAYHVLLTLSAGALVLFMGLLRLGFMVDLISGSVTSGFTSGTAVIIVAGQLKGLLGLSFGADSVLANVRQLFAHWRMVRATDAALAAACCAALLLLRKLPDVSVRSLRVRKALWLAGIGRNALVVLAASCLAYAMHRPDDPLFLLSGRVEPGLPRLAWPALSVREGNATVALPAMLRRLGPAVPLLPVVMVIANIAIAKAFTAGGRVDASQEMVTLGLCNMAGALVGAMPACGAFTRSAVAHASGVRTPAAGLYSGVITLLALAFLTPYFYFIPKACLSAVLICAVIFMIDVKIVVRLWREDRCELAVLVVTFMASVGLSVELGVLAGAAAALALMLRGMQAAPTHFFTAKTACGAVVIARPRAALVYLNAERVAARVRAVAATAHTRAGAATAHTPPPPAPLLMDLTRVPLIDHAAVQMLERLSCELAAAGRALVLYGAAPSVCKRLARCGIDARALHCRTAAAAAAAVATAAVAEPEATALLAPPPGAEPDPTV